MTESRAMLQIPTLPAPGSTPPFNPFPNGMPADLKRQRDELIRQGGERPAPGGTAGGAGKILLDGIGSVIGGPLGGIANIGAASAGASPLSLLGIDYPQLKNDAAKAGRDIATYAAFILIFVIAVYVFLKAGD